MTVGTRSGIGTPIRWAVDRGTDIMSHKKFLVFYKFVFVFRAKAEE